MELMLKIDLTEEQYNDLMQKSYDKIFDDKEFADVLKKVIADNMGEYLKTHPEIIKKILVGDEDYYYRNKKSTEIGKMIVEGAVKDYSSDISEETKCAIKQILKTVNLSNLLWSIITEAVRKGMADGLYTDFQMEHYRGDQLQSIVDEMKDKLGI